MNARVVCQTRVELGLALMDMGAVLTYESNHPLVVTRQGPNGVERGFKLKLHEKNPDAPLSPVYFNLRTPDNPKPGPLTPEIMYLVADCMHDRIRELGLTFTAIAGVPRAGDPIALALSQFYGMPLITLGKQEENGKRRIAPPEEGFSPDLKSVLLVDDLITRADSKREAIEVIRNGGIGVVDVIVILDREQGGAAELADLKCKLHALFTINELLNLYVAADKMKRETRSRIREYLASQS